MKTDMHPLYPYGSITDLDTLHKTLEHQGILKPMMYADVKNLVINSYSELNAKIPKYVATEIAVNYIKQFAISDKESTDETDLKRDIRDFVGVIKNNVSELKKMTSFGIGIFIKVSADRVDISFTQDGKPIFGEKITLIDYEQIQD